MPQLAEMANKTSEPKAPSTMAKAESRTPTRVEDEVENASVLVRDDGRTIIHHEVVAKIAGTAIREVHGVHELVPFDAGQKVSRLASQVVGRTMRNLGVQVQVGKVEAAVDAQIITDYGESIVEIADAIRAGVVNRIESMTGLHVVEVNIEVVDVHFPGDDSAEQHSDRVR